jgi:hypothetical protein
VRLVPVVQLANRVHVAPMGASDQIGVTRNCHVAPSPTEYNEDVGKRIQITSVRSRRSDHVGQITSGR